MYKHKIVFSNGLMHEFESKYYVSKLKVKNVNGARVLHFKDADLAANINHVTDWEINGEKIRLKEITNAKYNQS